MACESYGKERTEDSTAVDKPCFCSLMVFAAWVDSDCREDKSTPPAGRVGVPLEYIGREMSL